MKPIKIISDQSMNALFCNAYLKALNSKIVDITYGTADDVIKHYSENMDSDYCATILIGDVLDDEAIEAIENNKPVNEVALVLCNYREYVDVLSESDFVIINEGDKPWVYYLHEFIHSKKRLNVFGDSKIANEQNLEELFSMDVMNSSKVSQFIINMYQSMIPTDFVEWLEERLVNVNNLIIDPRFEDASEKITRFQEFNDTIGINNSFRARINLNPVISTVDVLNKKEGLRGNDVMRTTEGVFTTLLSFNERNLTKLFDEFKEDSVFVVYAPFISRIFVFTSFERDMSTVIPYAKYRMYAREYPSYMLPQILRC